MRDEIGKVFGAYAVNLHNIWREILHAIWHTFGGARKLFTEMSQLALLSESARTVALNRFRDIATAS